MRYFLITACILLVAVCGCSENRITTWVMTGQDTDLVGRLGVENNGTEVGGVIKYGVSDDITWGPEPEFAGAYLLFHLTQEVSIEDVGELSPLQPWLEQLHALPYAGLEVVGNTDSRFRNAQPNWIAGTKFVLDPEANVGLVVEYSDGDQARGDVYVGMRYQF